MINNYKAHDALESGVYLVEAWSPSGCRHGIFSTVEQAKTWMDALPLEYSCVCALFIIDSPEYGNVPKGEQH